MEKLIEYFVLMVGLHWVNLAGLHMESRQFVAWQFLQVAELQVEHTEGRLLDLKQRWQVLVQSTRLIRLELAIAG